MMTELLRLTRRLLTLAVLALPVAANASEILTVNTDSGSTTLSFDELSALPQTTVVTANDYTDGQVEFTGPSLKSILEANGVGPDATLIMSAINDFSVKIPAADAYKYNVILAMLSNGEPMSIRDKGPIWVIYPMDDHDELKDDLYNSRLVWQLKSISVE